MNHICSNCANEFQIERSTRSPKAWGLGIRGIYTTDYATAIDEYQVVICPKCGHRERDSNLRIFGILDASQFKKVVVLALAVLALVGIVNLLMWYMKS